MTLAQVLGKTVQRILVRLVVIVPTFERAFDFFEELVAVDAFNMAVAEGDGISARVALDGGFDDPLVAGPRELLDPVS